VECLKKKIREQIQEKFDSVDVVVPFMQNNKQRFRLKCNRCSFQGRCLESHMVKKHKVHKNEAKEHCTGMVKEVKHMARFVVLQFVIL